MLILQINIKMNTVLDGALIYWDSLDFEIWDKDFSICSIVVHCSCWIMGFYFVRKKKYLLASCSVLIWLKHADKPPVSRLCWSVYSRVFSDVVPLISTRCCCGKTLTVLKWTGKPQTFSLHFALLRTVFQIAHNHNLIVSVGFKISEQHPLSFGRQVEWKKKVATL